MSLSDRIAQAVDTTVCRTCAFYDALSPKDQRNFDKWIANGRPIEGLLNLCVEEGLVVSASPFKRHVRNHHGKR
jgi:hypothetical protein